LVQGNNDFSSIFMFENVDAAVEGRVHERGLRWDLIVESGVFQSHIER
jgi:hypothetical protein